MRGADVVALVFFYVGLLLLVSGTVTFIRKTFKRVRHAEVMIIERFGRYKDTLKPGVHFLNPFTEAPRTINWKYLEKVPGAEAVQSVHVETDRIDLREHCIDLGKQHVITKDTVQINVDAVLYYQIIDPVLAVYSIANLPDALTLLTQTTLRNIIAQITLDETFSSRDLINQRLKDKTSRDAERWGVSITRVEIMNIFAPEDIRDAMEKQIKEERERRSSVLRADGEREAAIVSSKGNAAKIILRAEGEKTAQIQRARGAAEAKMLLAQAESESIKAIRAAIGASANATDYVVALSYLSALRSISQARALQVVLLPSEVLQSLNPTS